MAADLGSAEALAREYLEILCSGRDLDRLSGLLHPQLEFRGPFLHTDSACAYLEALQADPPAEWQCRVEYVLQAGPRINLLYRFQKPGISTLMSQLFEIEAGLIRRMLLIFDTAVFNPRA